MAQLLPRQSTFVVDLLTTLRHERFSPAAWARFLRRSWDMSRHTARAHPALARSWQRVAVSLSILALSMFFASFLVEGASIALRLLPGFLYCVTWQISDLYWHLGLIRGVRRDWPCACPGGMEDACSPPGQAQGQSLHTPCKDVDPLYSTVGFANFFTQLRGLAASFLLVRLIGGAATPTGLALLLFAFGVLTDILDGQVARHTHTQSNLGQLTDGEADFCLYLAITIILIQNSILPLWLGITMLARFLIPLLAALASYFLFARRVRFGSTLWGKLAGLAQCLYFFVLLAPAQLATITKLVNLPLLIVTLALLAAAPTAQIVENAQLPNRLLRHFFTMHSNARTLTMHLRSPSASATMLIGGIVAGKDFSDEDTTST